VFELMNVTWNRATRQPAVIALCLEAVDILDDPRLRFGGIDQEEVVPLAIGARLSPYNAAYLWLVRALRIPLVTLDRKLGAQAASL
jgi:predicted nucleic acid-binding protein